MYDSGMIHKFQKAKTYADEPGRIHFKDLRVDFDGDNNQHAVEFNDGEWSCDCSYFTSHRTCSHVMAMDRVLGVMAPHGN
jgi:hypothetical protein